LLLPTSANGAHGLKSTDVAGDARNRFGIHLLGYPSRFWGDLGLKLERFGLVFLMTLNYLIYYRVASGSRNRLQGVIFKFGIHLVIRNRQQTKGCVLNVF
jgi:hypothetical protein